MREFVRLTVTRPWRWLGLATALSLGVVLWEYLLNTILNPQVQWNLVGVGAHMALDLAMLLPLVAISLAAGLLLSRRLRLDRGTSAGLLGTVGVMTLVFVLAVLPVASVRDVAHEWMGVNYGLSLAEVQTTVVTSDLTVQEATQLCSFSSVRNPSLVRDSYQDLEATVLMRVRYGAEAALMQLAAFLPLLLLGLYGFNRRRVGALHFAPVVALLRARPVRLGTTVALSAFVLFCVGYGAEDPGANVAHAQVGATPFNACVEGGEVKTYDVSAIPVTMTLNRYGDHVNNAFMYALDANIPEIQAFEAALDADRSAPEGPGVARVAHGLRKDPIQPMVIRANLGDCLRINFTNRLEDGQPASMHILGLPHTVDSAASAVGDNPDTFAQPGQTITYEIPVPLDVNAERAYYFHDHGAGRRRQNMGLFGAIAIEPRGSSYLDVETGQTLDTITGSNWEAIIIDPNLDGRSDGKSFREFVIFYHEIGDEGFTDIRDRDNKKLPLVDDVAGVYRPAARALNYRSEPFRRRLEIEKTGKALGYASYPFGDPSTPVPRSYVGEGVKTRLLHGGSEVFHVHHLHGGGDRWRRNPNADPNNDFWKGLTKVPDPNLTSIHLDSQSIGPGTSYNLEHECGAGGCQQGVGEFLFHCHIGHHYISGMWSFWRVFGTTQTAQTNVNGFPLFVEPRLFQNEANPVMAPAPPLPGVSAGDLIGLRVDDNKTIVADADFTNPNSQIPLTQWITDLLPPAGAPLDKFDATVWNWTSTGAGANYQVWGEPEALEPFEGYVSPTPGERPEVLFNPKNGRYTWPLFRPQKGHRPPFTARHTGAPWLGEEMKPGRLDGLCAVNGLHPAVDVGPTAVKRFYPVSAITLPIQVTPDRVDLDGQIFVLNEHEQAIRSGSQAVEPLAIRSNVGDCVEIIFTNKIPDGPLNKDFSKVNIHSHFVQFDTQASDGVITGFSYEQSVRPIESEGRELTAPATPNSTTLKVNHVDRLRVGIWLGIGLGEGVCGTTAQGQPRRCTEIRKIVDIPDGNTIIVDQPLELAHQRGEAVGVEFVRYHWYSDVDFGTVFYHTHVEFKDWDHGLFGTHIVEPKGSTYHDPQTGQEVRAGTLVDIRVDPAAGANPVAFGVEGSFREFMLFLHNNNPAEGRFTRGGGTINLRAEPWRLRDDGDPAHLFSSVTHGDPYTQEIRAYVGDPIVVRGMGLVERVGGIRFAGHRFNMERYTDQSDTRDTTFLGISERFDVSLEGGAGGPGGFPGDYLYYSTLGKDFESGAWGLLRVHDTLEPDLKPLPGLRPQGGNGFPQLSFTGGAPPVSVGPGNSCPPGAPLREYAIVIADSRIYYNELTAPDVGGTVYHLGGQPSLERRTPLVLRANAGDCLALNLRNNRAVRSGINVGELISDPQHNAGAAIGFNLDSSVEPGRGRRYEFYADKELGIVLGLNLADVNSIENGAFAGIVIEPEGSIYRRPGRATALPRGGAGVQADIITNGVLTREFVALFSDQDRRIGQNAMPYPVDIENFNGINYSAEPLRLRDRIANPSGVFKSSLWGDPRHVVTVPAGTPLTYRVAQPWGNQMHVPTLEGHRFLLEPGMAGSEQLYNDVLAPGMSLNLHFVGGAGGDISAPGDYLFLDRRQPFLEGGLWNILRVTNGASGGDDRVVVQYGMVQEVEGQNQLRIKGVNSLRPAGDYAEAVTVHAGGAVNGACTGGVLGVAAVNPGSGSWRLEEDIAGSPSEVCIESPGGGVATALLQ
jgi:manganese oxidase